MRGAKTGGKNWKPGQSGNPKGMPPHPPELKEAKKFTVNEVIVSFSKFLRMDVNELSAIANDKTTNVLDAIIARIMYLAAQKGDQARLDFILNRIIGKVTEKVEHSLPEPLVIKRSSGEQVILGSKLSEEVKEIEAKNSD